MSAGEAGRAVVLAVLVALALRLGLFVAAEQVKPTGGMVPDSYDYERLGRTLLHHGRFAGGAQEAAHTRRTPLYPALIALVYAGWGEDPRAVLVVQTVASTLTVCLAFAAAAVLWGARAGLMAALLLAFDVPSIVASTLLLTETAFAAVMAAVAVMAISLLSPSPPPAGRAVALGALLAIAGLTRPIGLYLAPPVALWLVLSGRVLGWGGAATARTVACMAIPCLLLIGGWQVRNGITTGEYVMSEGPAKFLLLGRGADILAQRDGIPVEDARRILAQSVLEAQRRGGAGRDSLYLAPALALVARHPLLFAQTQVRWLPELMLGTGAAGVVERMGLSADGRGRRVAQWAVGAGALGHLLLVYVAAAAGLWRVRREGPRQRLALVFLAGVTAYFVVLSTGPQAYSRFRVPFMPLLAVAAAGGIVGRWPSAPDLSRPA